MSETKNIYQRINEAGKALQGRIPKDGWNPEQKYKFTSHDGAVELVRPVLMEAGIVFVMTCKSSEITQQEKASQYGTKILYNASVMFECAMINIDSPADRHIFDVPAYAFDYSDKALGKAISYAKKYALLAMCGLLLATGDDSEADKTSPGAEPPRKQATKPATPPETKQADKVKDVAKQSLWKTAKKFNLADIPKLEAYAAANGINVPLSDMTAKDMNTLEGILIVNETKTNEGSSHE